jgi:acyl-CoA reductase-like NAD-dependent aldehyde dehydrogenase
MMHEAGVPKGVFNLVNGDGPTVGEAISRHPDVDMVSFTGSTRAGILVAKAAADTVKRVHQELGGKSANIILDDADLNKAVKLGVESVMRNSGQSCNAPTRMFVPEGLHDKAVAIAKATAEPLKVGAPPRTTAFLGPVVSEAQYNKIQKLIEAGIKEGADLVTGGSGRPRGPQSRLLCSPDRLRGRDRRDAHRARGDLRPRGRSGQGRQAVAPKLRAGMVAVNAWGPGRARRSAATRHRATAAKAGCSGSRTSWK